MIPWPLHYYNFLSLELTSYFEELDKRADLQQKEQKKHVPDRKKRKLGSNLDNCPPKGSPKWTISKDWLKSKIIVIVCAIITS